MSEASNFGVSLELIQRYSWEDILADTDKYRESGSSLFAQASKCKAEGDDLGERVYRFIGAVMSLSPNFDSKDEVFRPMWTEATRRSSALQDFTDEDLRILGQLATSAKKSHVRARLADVAVTRKFDHNLVREAAAAYLENAKQLEANEDWPIFLPPLERAAQLAWKLGKKGSLFLDVISYVEALVVKVAANETKFCCARLMQLLQEFGVGDPMIYAPIAEEIAERTEQAEAFVARTYWELAAEWYSRKKDKEESQRCAIRAAETYVLEAEAALQRKVPSIMASAGLLAQSVEALRRSDAPKERRDEVHRLLLERQKRTREEMGQFSHDVEIGDLQKQARELVKGCDLREAIIRLVTQATPLNPKKHREYIEQLAKDHPITYLFSASFVDREGRVTAQRPSLLTSDPVQYEAGLWAEMMRQATSINWPFRISAFIDPCRMQISLDLEPRIRDLSFLVSNNPFIPPGHEHSFARGFHAGFVGDFHGAAYFLIPQVEESIRYVLENRGVITSKLDNKLVQEVRSLDKLLQMPETVEVFGEDHVFELRGILTEEFGSNLRNRLAHGLLADGECFLPSVMHLWWILIRLCIAPLLSEQGTPANEIPPE
jgi:hypothetical protein